jgi:hypothetical protein
MTAIQQRLSNPQREIDEFRCRDETSSAPCQHTQLENCVEWSKRRKRGPIYRCFVSAPCSVSPWDARFVPWTGSSTSPCQFRTWPPLPGESSLCRGWFWQSGWMRLPKTTRESEFNRPFQKFARPSQWVAQSQRTSCNSVCVFGLRAELCARRSSASAGDVQDMELSDADFTEGHFNCLLAGYSPATSQPAICIRVKVDWNCEIVRHLGQTASIPLRSRANDLMPSRRQDVHVTARCPADRGNRIVHL